MPMRSFRTSFQTIAILACTLLSIWCAPMSAQQPAAGSKPASPAASTAAAADTQTLPDQEFVHKQFGTEFTLLPQFPAMVADLDGDGVADLVLAATAKNPMLDEGNMNYKGIDPYYEFFGYGNPKITTGFGTEDPTRKGEVLLIIHGAGPDAWRSATPKAKFVVVNLPYKLISVRRVRIGKKTLMAITALEFGGTQDTSAVFWNGKKYKYQPLGSALE